MMNVAGSSLVAVCALVAASAAQADFRVDPKLLAALPEVASSRPAGPTGPFGVSGVIDESPRQAAAIAQALSEWNSARKALDAASKRLTALLNPGRLPPQAGADTAQHQAARTEMLQPPVQSMPAPVPTPLQSTAPIGTDPAERLYLAGATDHDRSALKLKPGEYSRAKFLAAVLPRGFKLAFVGGGKPFAKVSISGPPRPWEQWLESAGEATHTVFTVLHKNRLVMYSNSSATAVAGESGAEQPGSDLGQ